MNLCMTNAFFHPYVGGIENHMYELGKRLAKRDEIHVITTQIPNTKPEEDLEGIHVHRIPAMTYKVPLLSPPPLVVSPRFKKKLKALDMNYNFDSFALHSRYFPDFIYTLKYAYEKGKFSTFTVHDQRIIGVDAALDAFSTAYDAIYGIKSISKASKFIAVSHSVADDLDFFGFEENKIKMIYNGVDTAFFKPSKQTFKERYMNGFDNLIITSGRLVMQKGIQYLIKAMPQILKQHPRTKLLIVGKGLFDFYLKMLIKKMKLQKNVELLGFIPTAELPNMYSSADIFCAPSLIEPFGLVVLEAMSCGSAVVSTNVGGLPEVLDDCGFLVKPKNSEALARHINLLLSDKVLRERFSKKGRKRALNMFDWDLIAKQTRKFYLDNL